MFFTGSDDLVHSLIWLGGGLLFVVLFAYWCAHDPPCVSALTTSRLHGSSDTAALHRVKFLEDNLSPSVRQKRREEATARATGRAPPRGGEARQRKPSAA